MAEVQTASPWMTSTQVAEYLGRHRNTILRWQRTLEFPRHKSETGMVRYHRDEVDRWMQKHFSWYEIPSEGETHE